MVESNKKINKKQRPPCQQAGMTYVELIVVLSIFSIMTSVVLFDYGKFQATVDIKVLANDIASKIVEAQKTALTGILSQKNYPFTWKPSYGVYFDTTLNNKRFVYFADLNQSQDYSLSGSCANLLDTNDECVDQIIINKGNYISKIETYIGSDATLISNFPLSITFQRPDSSAIFKSQGFLITGIDFVQITITSQRGAGAKIKVYPSGRIQIN